MVATTTSSAIQSRIAARLQDVNSVAVSVANIQQAINDAIAFWKVNKFYFNQKKVVITLDISAATDGSMSSDPFILQYGNTNPLFPNAPVLPSDFLFEDQKNGFVINYSNVNYKINKQPPDIYDQVFTTNGNGIPSIYCYRDGNYEIYYLPQLAYSCTVNYIKDYVPLTFSSPTETNDFTNYADKLIEYDAIGRLLADLRQDDERAARFFARAQDEFKNLQSRSAKQNATGRLSVDAF